MALLDIRVLGDPILRQATTPVGTVTDDLRRLAQDMLETMYVARGIGLAAPQVGRTERLAVVDIEDGPMVMINPEIVRTEGPTEKSEEGCLSIPEVYGDVERPTRITVRYMDADGAIVERDADELLARCIQHEVDHLDGKLFIDYLGPFKRRTALAKWTREKEQYPGNIRRLTAEEIAEHHHNGEEL
ncbi:MAG: peptide deformylase [Gemmatimonadaceae bacterium]|nr:peptide deformylase [Gemmatimonadaceae bacterium]